MRINRVAIAATTTAAIIGLGAAPAGAAPATAPPPTPSSQNVSSVTAAVTGSWSDRHGHGGAINATISPQSVTVTGPTHQVLLNTAVKLRAEGTPLNTTQQVAIPTSASALGLQSGATTAVSAPTAITAPTPPAVTPIPVPAGCPVLHLVLGPLNLNLLGLTIVLQQVTLDIVAVPGPGNLLGNLLCGLVNLLNGLAPPPA